MFKKLLHFLCLIAIFSGTITAANDPSLAAQTVTTVSPQISAGVNHTCAVSPQGSMTCWGDNSYGQSAGATNVSQVSSGGDSTCYQTMAGTPKCQGGSGVLTGPFNVPVFNFFNQLFNHGPIHLASAGYWDDALVGCFYPLNHPCLFDGTDTAITEVEAGAKYVCTVSSLNTGACLGDDSFGQLDIPNDVVNQIAHISAGGYHACALDLSQMARCWGYNAFGQTNVPTDLGPVLQVSAGGYHTCVILLTKLAKCWGRNFDGQSSVPADLGQVVQISAGGYHTCAIQVSGTVRCWGRNDHGQTSVPAGLNLAAPLSLTPTPLIVGATTPTATLTVDSGIWDDAVNLTYQWLRDGVPINGSTSVSYKSGLSDSGHQISVQVTGQKLGYLSSTQTSSPITISTVKIKPDVQFGSQSACALSSIGVVTCWGSNDYGRAVVPSDLGVTTQLATSSPQPCALDILGKVRCWGATHWGGLGENFISMPTDIGQVLSIQGSVNGTCAITIDKLAKCWGNDAYGQMEVPANLGQVSQVSVSDNNVCAVTIAGSVRCWGDNHSNQIYVPSDLAPAIKVTQDRTGGICSISTERLVRCWGGISTPQGLGRLLSLTSGSDNFCALVDENKQIYCWGSNVFGERKPPALYPTMSQVQSIGNSLNCALASTGQLSCWGWNPSFFIQPPSSKTIFTDLFGGTSGTGCALDILGNLICWGDNSHGQASVPNGLALIPKLTKTPQPVIVGDAMVNSVLSVAPGEWDSGVSLGYQWLLDGQAIQGFTGTQYQVDPYDVDHQIQVSVTGRSEGYGGSTQLSAPITVAAAPFGFNSSPQIAGGYSVGSKLTASVDWGGLQSVTYQWHRDGLSISEATGATYQIAGQDYGHVLTCSATAVATGYVTTTKTSIPIYPEKGRLSLPPNPQITGSKGLGDIVRVDSQNWGVGVAVTYQWFHGGTPISGATDNIYKLGPADFGQQIHVEVTGTKDGYFQSTQVSDSFTENQQIFQSQPNPILLGDSTIGGLLTANPGTWDAGAQITYQWLRDGIAIAQATDQSYTSSTSDYGHKISVLVTAEELGFTTVTKYSSAIDIVLPFSVTTKPYVIGQARVGNSLSGSFDDWDKVATLSYAWSRDGKTILGSNSRNYLVKVADYGHDLTFSVIGSANGYLTTTRTSDPVTVLGVLANTPIPTIAGVTTLGMNLTANAGNWDNGVQLTYQWLRDNTPILGANGNSYFLTPADCGHSLSIQVTGSLQGFFPSSQISPAQVIALASMTQIPPKLTGTFKAKQTIKANVKSWVAGASISFKWLLDGKPIKGATKSSYILLAAQKGHKVSLNVTQTAPGYVAATSSTLPTKVG